MILWVIVGIIILYFSPNRRAAIRAGALFGFFNIAAWLASGFQGRADQLAGFAILALILSVLGAACGIFGAFIFYRLVRPLK